MKASDLKKGCLYINLGPPDDDEFIYRGEIYRYTGRMDSSLSGNICYIMRAVSVTGPVVPGENLQALKFDEVSLEYIEEIEC